MPNALRAVGPQHILGNMLKSAHGTISNFEHIFKQLKQLEFLLTRPYRRDRLKRTCVVGTEYEALWFRTDRWTTKLYEACWHEVSAFCSRLRPHIPC